MILGYKQYFPFNREPTNFLMKILKGTKIHSIRKDIHNRWKPDLLIHHAYGVRTKNYQCFKEDQCKCVQTISIEYLEEREIFSFLVAERVLELDEYLYKRVRVNIGGRYVSERIVNELARNDGFDSIIDFFRWFNKPFTGKIIHWTDLRY
jgi:hypothetical protein